MCCSHFRDVKKWEILYPGVFSDFHPYKATSIHPSWLGAVTDRSNTLPILSLVHVTHNKEADQIRSGDVNSFLPRQKLGKTKHVQTRTVLHIGETYKQIVGERYQYQRVVPGGPLIPGCCLSWWSISTHHLQENDVGRKFRKLLCDAQSKCPYKLSEVGYLKMAPESTYGNKGFVIPFHDLINCYRTSRTDCQRKHVYLKKGGTLRYKREVCYVIMVVMEEDNQAGYFSMLPSMFDEPCFEHNGCINREGKVVSDKTPYFNISHPFSELDCWESLAFAFVFLSQKQLPLQCPKELCKELEVSHERCTSTQPHPQTNEWVCPNRLQ